MHEQISGFGGASGQLIERTDTVFFSFFFTLVIHSVYHSAATFAKQTKTTAHERIHSSFISSKRYEWATIINEIEIEQNKKKSLVLGITELQGKQRTTERRSKECSIRFRGIMRHSMECSASSNVAYLAVLAHFIGELNSVKPT